MINSSYPTLIKEYQTYQDYFKGIELFYDDKAWEKAISTNTKASYENYLKEYPEGTHASEATNIIDDIVTEQKAWDEAQKSDNEKAYEDYLNNFQTGIYRTEAQQRLNELIKDRESWENAQSIDTKQAYDDYFKNNPKGKYYESASSRQLEIVNDEKAWEKAKKDDTYASYEAYLKEHSNGFFRDEAKQKLKELQEDEESWKQTLKTNAEKSYQEYLKQYPKAVHSTEAKDKIKDFQAWEETKKTDTKVSYEQYRKNHPNGIFKQEVSLKLEAIESDEKAWKEAIDINTKTSYEKYLQEQANGLFIDEANKKIETIIKNEEKLWEKTKKSDTINAFTKYLDTYKDALHKDKAQQRLDELTKDKTIWEQVKKTNTLTAYKNYIKDYPKGKFIPQAIQKRDNLLEIIEQDDMWERTKKLDSKDAYTKYLNKYPNGKYSSEATKKLDEFIAKEKDLEFTRTHKIYWQQIQEKNTKVGYANYLEKYPNGMFKDEARKRLDEFLSIEQEEELWKEAEYKPFKDNNERIQNLEKYIKNTKIGKYTSVARKKILELEREVNRNIGIGSIIFLVLIIGIYFIFFHVHVRDTKFYISPNSSAVYINEKQEIIYDGDKFELPEKYNTIKVEKEGYKTKVIKDVKQGRKSVSITLGKGYYINLKFTKSDSIFLATPDKIFINNKIIPISNDNQYELPLKINQISVELKGYMTETVDGIQQGTEDITIKLKEIYAIANEHYSKEEYLEAFELFKRISDDKRSFIYLGWLYDQLDNNNEKSLEFYMKGCDANYAQSCYFLGRKYEDTKGDNKIALEYYRKSSELGDKNGHCSSASMYFYPRKGVIQNISKAKEYLLKGFPNKVYCNKLKEDLSYEGVVLDNIQGLYWEDTFNNSINYANWTDANKYCNNLSLKNYTDWRLPSKNELLYISKKETLSYKNFKYHRGYFYWSSLEYENNHNKAWFVNLYDGDYNYSYKSSGNSFRCVRNIK